MEAVYTFVTVYTGRFTLGGGLCNLERLALGVLWAGKPASVTTVGGGLQLGRFPTWGGLQLGLQLGVQLGLQLGLQLKNLGGLQTWAVYTL